MDEDNNNTSLDDVLRKIWEATESDDDDARTRRGMKRLERFIMKRRLVRWTSRVAGVVAVSACLVLFGAGMYRWWSSSSSSDGQEQPTRFVLATTTGSPGEFELPDGSHLWLNADSRLEYTDEFTTGKYRKVSLSGEGYFEVTRNPERPFRVELEHISVEVLGTSFNVRSYSTEPDEDVVLLTGSVRVDGNDGNTSVTLMPDEKFCYDVSTSSGVVSKVNARSYCQWYDREMVFDNTELKDIIANVERKYGVTVKVANGIDMEKRLSLVVADETVSDVMAVIGSLVGCRVAISGDSITMSLK